jgi:hypothetical protein
VEYLYRLEYVEYGDGFGMVVGVEYVGGMVDEKKKRRKCWNNGGIWIIWKSKV